MELPIENGFDGFADVLHILFNETMRIESDRALGTGRSERCQSRRGRASGCKPSTVETRILPWTSHSSELGNEGKEVSMPNDPPAG